MQHGRAKGDAESRVTFRARESRKVEGVVGVVFGRLCIRYTADHEPRRFSTVWPRKKGKEERLANVQLVYQARDEAVGLKARESVSKPCLVLSRIATSC